MTVSKEVITVIEVDTPDGGGGVLQAVDSILRSIAFTGCKAVITKIRPWLVCGHRTQSNSSDACWPLVKFRKVRACRTSPYCAEHARDMDEREEANAQAGRGRIKCG